MSYVGGCRLVRRSYRYWGRFWVHLWCVLRSRMRKQVDAEHRVPAPQELLRGCTQVQIVASGSPDTEESVLLYRKYRSTDSGLPEVQNTSTENRFRPEHDGNTDHGEYKYRNLSTEVQDVALSPLSMLQRVLPPAAVCGPQHVRCRVVVLLPSCQP